MIDKEKELMIGEYAVSFHDSIIRAVEYFVLNPDSFKDFNKTYPFNGEEFQDIDWTKVSSVEFNDDRILIITL